MAIEPAVYDLTVYRGTTMDLTADVEGLLITGGTAVVECAIPVTGSVDDDLNQLRLTLTPTQTENAQPGRYPYEAYVHLPGGVIHMLLMGHITIADGVIA